MGISLNKLQKQAVEYLDGPLLVLAGPGTGKTQLLSSKVAYILQNTDTAPESILCLTYTENGATNMRERLLSIIGPAASKITIGTYHAFGQTILTAYQNYSDTPTRHYDQTIDDVTKFKIITTIQNNLPPYDILKRDQTKDIISTISSAKSARLSPEDLALIATDNLETTEKINAEINEPLKNLVPRMKFDLALSEVYRPLLEIFEKYISPKPIIGSIEKEVNFLARSLAELIETEQNKEKPSISPLTSWKNSTFELDDNGNYRLANHIANKKLLSLAKVMKSYQNYLEEQGYFDFDDMIQDAIHYLKTDRGFRLTLSERYQYLLLDEFQDTNPSEFEIVKLLTDYESPSIMAVGDDDQAIFEFQGASASNLLDFQNHYNAKVITLTDNYRSTSDILALSHRVANQITESFAKKHGIDKILTAMKNTRAGDTRISRHEFISSDAEYYWLADTISDLIAHGESPSDIAVITPFHKYILPLLPYLKAKNIPVNYEKRSDVLTSPEMVELLKLSRFIYLLASEKPASHLLLEILSFPFWELDSLEILKTVRAAKSSDQPFLLALADSDNEKISAIAHFFTDLVQIAFEAPLELFLDCLIGIEPLNEFISPYLSFYTSEKVDSARFELYEQLASLRSAISSHTKSEVAKLEDLINFISDYELASAAVLNTSPYQDAENSVNLMSVHKSKGLEFKHVFLIAVDNLTWGTAKGNNNLLSLPKNLIQIRHTGATEDERLRLFFVAMTRAKDSLIMTNSIKDFSGKTPARLQYLAEFENDRGEIISPYLPEGSQVVISHTADLDEAKRQTDLELHWSSAYKEYAPALKPLLQNKLKNYHLSASNLTSFIDIIYAGPVNFFYNNILGAPSEPATEQILLGNLIHKTFEKITREGITDDDAFHSFHEEAKKQPLLREDLDILLEKGNQSLTKSLNAFRTILRDPTARAEVDLRPEHPTLDDVPLTGKIDHISIDPEAKTIEIYDFKTGPYHNSGWNSHPALYKYRLQLGFYKLLLNLSPTYRSYKIKRAHILFVTPDPKSGGAVHDKAYDFTDKNGLKDEAELKELIKAVYHEIKTLDYLDNSKIALTPDKSRALKDIKDFVKLLIDKNSQM